MVYELVNEYLKCAEATAPVDYSDMKSVQQYNFCVHRMRAIVNDVVKLGQPAIIDFVSVLDVEPAAIWAAHQLVELADLDLNILLKCFERVEQARLKAEAEGDLAVAMGEDMWLKEWKAKKALS